jgi:hypothetical protein
VSKVQVDHDSMAKLFEYFKSLAVEHEAMALTLRDWKSRGVLNWQNDYKSYLGMASQAIGTIFQGLEHAIAQGSDVQQELDRLLGQLPPHLR